MKKHLPCIIAFLVIFPITIKAETVTGTVKSLFTRTPIPNVTVFAENRTTVYGITDSTGHYTINNVIRGIGRLLFRSSSHLDAVHDSVNFYGNIVFNAVLPETIHVNSDSTHSVVRVNAHELKSPFAGDWGGYHYNVTVWDTKVNKTIPVQVRGFSPSESTDIINDLRWRMALGDTNYFQFIPGIVRLDTTPGTIIDNNVGNYCWTVERNGYIFNAYVSLWGPQFRSTVLHEATYHGLATPTSDTAAYMPTNYWSYTRWVTQPKDITYMDIVYELNYIKRDSIPNDLLFSDYVDSITVGVEEKPDENLFITKGKSVLRVKPLPFTAFTTIQGHEKERFAIFDITGRCVGIYPGNRVGKDEVPGVYFIIDVGNKYTPARVVKIK